MKGARPGLEHLCWQGSFWLYLLTSFTAIPTWQTLLTKKQTNKKNQLNSSITPDQVLKRATGESSEFVHCDHDEVRVRVRDGAKGIFTPVIFKCELLCELFA